MVARHLAELSLVDTEAVVSLTLVEVAAQCFLVAAVTTTLSEVVDLDLEEAATLHASMPP